MTECLEAYSDLDETQRKSLEDYLTTPPYVEARPLLITTFEKGLAEGLAQGEAKGLAKGEAKGVLRGEREAALRLLAAKFGPLEEDARLAIEAMTLDRLIQLQLDAIRAERIEDCLPLQ